jgi:guanylate kinase
LAGILFIISAPSGSGKSTLVNELRSNVKDLQFSVSFTTRQPRGSEQEGLAYHFVSREQFEKMIAADDLLEYAEVFGNYYGTGRGPLQEAFARGKDMLLDIDVQGAAQVRHKMPEAVSIFIMPPTPEILERRLRNRSRAEGKVDEEVIARRLAKARHEIENYHSYKYVLVNDELNRAVEDLTAIVKAERYQREGRAEPGKTSDGVQRVLHLAEACRQQNAAPRLQPALKAFDVPLHPAAATATSGIS